MPADAAAETIRVLYAAADDFGDALDAVLQRGGGADAKVRETVTDIVADVRARGDAAVIDYTQKFDRVTYDADSLRVPLSEIDNATVDKDVEEALQMAAQRIHAYHERMYPDDVDYIDESAVRLGARWTPIASAGLYVPGGTAAYPSSVLMNAIPANVAGVERLVMTVPTPDGVLNPLYLVAARIAGIEEIYRVGGAQAIAALAYGTDMIAPVKKIVGPGNAWVAEAKRQVFGTVGIDTIAGPSEVLVMADDDTPPEWVASDLLTQAEHDVLASAILVVEDAAYGKEVIAALDRLLADLPRAEIARKSLANHSAVICVTDLMDDGAEIVNHIAPEHLSLCVRNPEALMEMIDYAGAIFIGKYSSEALGDYAAGPSHVLPTYGASAFSSGLSVSDFMTRSSYMGFDRNSLASVGPAASLLAKAEGLHAHALSIDLRLKAGEGS